MHTKSLKRFMTGAIAVAVISLVVAIYSLIVKKTDVFAFAAVFTLASIQCAMNAHLAMVRSALSNGIRKIKA
jgi:hypothetical protein